MATMVIMPKQGQSVETCIITKWFRKKGEKVSAGDILFSYETDKAAFDLESPAEGILLDIFYQEGSEVPVLQNVAVIGQPGEATEIRIPEPEKPETQETASLIAIASDMAATNKASADNQDQDIAEGKEICRTQRH
jgi:pyruvate/2-oxoglutarate dehydrogenase complex dihydrolipoamide acyltransferase (E2) component